MIRQFNVFGTFLAFAITLAVAQDVPTRIATLPAQSVAIAQKTATRYGQQCKLSPLTPCVHQRQ